MMDEETPAVQVNVEIPPGTRRLTIELDPNDGGPGYAVVAHAGFVTQ